MLFMLWRLQGCPLGRTSTILQYFEGLLLSELQMAKVASLCMHVQGTRTPCT